MSPLQYLVCVGALALSACTSIPPVSERRALADSLAASVGWKAAMLQSGDFDLMAYYNPQAQRSDRLVVFLEGDGLAFVSPSQASNDPTPTDPLALRMAISHPPGDAVVYVARPCQFFIAHAAKCSPRYWLQSRFAPEVVAATSKAIDGLKQRFESSRVVLVGYSGGGGVAALVAARRTDIEKLVTVAGNLDHEAWTRLHRIAPLSDSLNPADVAHSMSTTAQWHFVGGRDFNVPVSIVQSYVRNAQNSGAIQVYVEPEFDHHCCWGQHWPRLWRMVSSNHFDI